MVTAESLTGQLFVAISTGAAFARLARSTARIRFSQQAVVHPDDGVPTLSFRLAPERGTIRREPRRRAELAVDEISREGHRLRRLRPLHAQASWPGDRIRFGACCADMDSAPEQGEERHIDGSALGQLRPCPLI